MGKGTITSGGTAGNYVITVNYDSTHKDREIARLENAISVLEGKIIAEQAKVKPDQIKIKVWGLEIKAAEKRIKYINDNTPEDFSTSAWCADLTDDLSGAVGTIEVPGEIGDIQIVPGFSGEAAYDVSRDGQLSPTLVMSAAAAFYNLAMLPGWQKWKPTFRYAKITSIESEMASITLDTTSSSQQDITINQELTIDDVEIEYMDCDSSAFKVGDNVLVKFTGQDWEAPIIIGFKEDPQPCGEFLYISHDNWGIVWDMETNDFAEGIIGQSGNPITEWPATTLELLPWRSKTEVAGYTETFWELKSRPSSTRLQIPVIGTKETADLTNEREEGTCSGVDISTSYIRHIRTYIATLWDPPAPQIGEGILYFRQIISDHVIRNDHSGNVVNYYPIICGEPTDVNFGPYNIDLFMELDTKSDRDLITAKFGLPNLHDSTSSRSISYTLKSPIGEVNVSIANEATSIKWGDGYTITEEETTLTGTNVYLAEPRPVRIFKHSDNSVVQFYTLQSQTLTYTGPRSFNVNEKVLDIMISADTEPLGLAEAGYIPVGANRIPSLESAVKQMYLNNSAYWSPTVEFRQ